MLPIPVDSLIDILSYTANPEDWQAASLVDPNWASAASSPFLWRNYAMTRYGEDVVEACRPLYPNYRAMIEDDCRLGATPCRSIRRVALWQYQDWVRHLGMRSDLPRLYACWVEEIRVEGDTLKVALSVRGQSDLAHPWTASIRMASQQGGRWHQQRCQPVKWHAEIDQPGHYQGWLYFAAQDLQGGVSLEFCYGSNHHVAFGDMFVYDFDPIALSPAGQGLDELKEYCCKDAPLPPEPQWNQWLPSHVLTLD